MQMTMVSYALQQAGSQNFLNSPIVTMSTSAKRVKDRFL